MTLANIPKPEPRMHPGSPVGLMSPQGPQAVPQGTDRCRGQTERQKGRLTKTRMLGMTILSLSRPRDLSGWNWKLRYSRKDTVSLSLKVMLLLCLNSLWARKPVGQLPGSQRPSDVCTRLGRLPSICPPATCPLQDTAPKRL